MFRTIRKEIEEIASSLKGEFRKIELFIECPLDTGVSVKTNAVCLEGNVALSIARVRPFFKFVEELRASSFEKFNRVKITVYPDLRITEEREFDRNLQEQAERDVL